MGLFPCGLRSRESDTVFDKTPWESDDPTQTMLFRTIR
jgi:hypothetical protein